MSKPTLFTATALAGGLFFILPAPVHAQSGDSAAVVTSSQSQTEAEEKADKDTILVTGSRIRRSAFDTLEPTISIDQKYLQDRGLTNIADALNELPGFRGSVTPAGAQGSYGQGVNFLNSFGLGSNRTLTLVNGRRVVSSNVSTIFGNASPGTQVDLNIINPILIDRTDRVSIGGAPVYGSDAIAGTVNVITKTRFTGLEVAATNGITQYGDNFRVNISAAYGRDFAGGRGNISFAANYEEVDGVMTNDRPFLRVGLGVQNNPTSAQAAQLGPIGRSPMNDGRINPLIGFNDSTTDGFPGAILVERAGIPSLSRGGVIVNNGALMPLDFNVQFAPDGTLIPYNRGILYAGVITSAAARNSRGDGFVFNDFTQITSDLRRISANLFINYDITDRIRFSAEGLYFGGRGDELVQQQAFNSSLFAGASSALVFSVNNPLLSQQARNLLVANGYTTFRLSRIHMDLGDATGVSKNDLYRGVIGVSGDFDAFGRSFNFELSGVYGRNDYSDFSQQINQQRFVNAINGCVATPTVNATPGFSPVADPNCVPLSVFGEGAPSQAARDYVIQDTLAKSRLEQWVINANIGGAPFDLFGNPVRFNAGYEHREEKASFTPDSFSRQGLGRSVAILPTQGAFNLDEVFGEVLLPIFTPRNDFLFHSLEVFARGRYVHNTVNGGFFAWAAGGSFYPIEDIQIRGNFTRSFRAPSIVELYAPLTNTFTTVADLCNPASVNAGPVPQIRARNCAAFLAKFPNGTPLAAATATVPGRSGGNPNLENEQADSFTFGVIARPRFIPGLTVSVDYLDIKLSKPIANLTVAQIVSGCFDNESFNADDPANGNIFCSRIRRDASGQVPADPANPAVTSGFVNGQQLLFEGIQASLEYVSKLQRLKLPGSISVAGELFYVKRRINDVTGVAPARSDGIVGDPEFQGQLRLRYFTEKLSFATNINYVGEQLISRFNRGAQPSDVREFDQYEDFITIDMGLGLQVTNKFRLSAAITNVTNRVGQGYFGYIIPGAVNDPLGRRFALTARVTY